MNIAIVDDESHCIESLVIHLNAQFPEMDIVYKTNKPEEALQQLTQKKIDLLFLDIEMPRLTGFELLEQIPNRSFDVIFTTAYSQYALRAFKAKAISYLLKPIDEDELKTSVADWKAHKQKDEDYNAVKIDQMIEQMKKDGFLKSKISVPISDGYEFIEVNKIMYCNSHSNYTSLHLIDGEKIMVSKTLKEVAEALKNFPFIRVHRSHLINPNYIKSFHKADGGYLVMSDKMMIPVSYQKRKLIIDIFEGINNDI